LIKSKELYQKFCFCSDAANNASTPPLLDYTEFYNSALDHMDLMQDYFNWQSPQRPGQFSYCQYPFILSIVAKRIILTKVTHTSN
jgi:E3 ubiquitin-protein ligase HECTD2